MKYLIFPVLCLIACGDSAGPRDVVVDEADATSDGVPQEGGAIREPDADDAQPDDAVTDAALDSENDAEAGGGESIADASQPDAAAPDPSLDGVPVFLAMGYGTRRIVSCDFGLTWKNDAADVPNGGDDGTLVRGLAYGDGKFVAVIGGGGTQVLATTADGVTFKRFNRGGNGFSDVTFGRGRFVAGGGHISSTSLDGYTWGSDVPMGSGGILRHLAFGAYDGGRFVGVGDGGRRMNSRDATSWGQEVSGGSNLNGIAFGAGVFVAITGSSSTVYSEDGGSTWKSGSIPGAGSVRGILYDGKRFIVTTNANTFTSTKGQSWTSHSASGGPAAFDVSDDGKHYAGASAGDLYHSTDGIEFTRVKQGGQGLTRVKFGRVQASDVCP